MYCEWLYVVKDETEADELAKEIVNQKVELEPTFYAEITKKVAAYTTYYGDERKVKNGLRYLQPGTKVLFVEGSLIFLDYVDYHQELFPKYDSTDWFKDLKKY